MNHYYEDLIKEYARLARKKVAYSKIYGREIDLNDPEEVIAALFLREHAQRTPPITNLNARLKVAGDKTWHIELPNEGSAMTRVYCRRPIKAVAPFTLSAESIFAHPGKFPVCRDCLFEVVTSMWLGDPEREDRSGV